jgi:hypothetical protein
VIYLLLTVTVNGMQQIHPVIYLLLTVSVNGMQQIHPVIFLLLNDIRSEISEPEQADPPVRHSLSTLPEERSLNVNIYVMEYLFCYFKFSGTKSVL